MDNSKFASNPTSKLEHIETTSISAFSGSYRSFLDQKSPKEADASRRFYEMISSTTGSLKLEQFEQCRTRAWFIRNRDSGRVRLASKQCRLRWCYHCSEARQQFITGAVMPWYQSARLPKLLTLTLKHNKKPLEDQIAFLYKCFAKLRGRKFFKDSCRGGVWFFQITFNKKKQEWHPHIHALIDSYFINNDDLSHVWKKITQDSKIIHIRCVDDPEKTLRHNARYAARPVSLLSIPEERWLELHNGFFGRRICGTWGTAKVISLRPHKPEDCEKWEDVGGWRTVQNLIEYDLNAKAIWRAWSTGEILPAGISVETIDEFIKDEPEYIRPPKKLWETDPFLHWNK